MPELLRYVFCWIAIFAFMTFAYRHAFYSTLLILKIFPEQVMFWPFRMAEYQMLFVVGMNLACSMFITIMIISLQKAIKNYCHRTDLKNKNGSLRLHGGFFLCFCVLKKIHKNTCYKPEYTGTFCHVTYASPLLSRTAYTFFQVNLKCQWTHPLPWNIKLI